MNFFENFLTYLYQTPRTHSHPAKEEANAKEIKVKWQTFKTRMHSSRMRTTRSSSHQGDLHQAPPPTRPPQSRHPSQGRHTTPLGFAPPRDQTPPVDRHTSVNILPCPKLRLRAVKMLALVLCEWVLMTRLCWNLSFMATIFTPLELLFLISSFKISCFQHRLKVPSCQTWTKTKKVRSILCYKTKSSTEIAQTKFLRSHCYVNKP